MRTRLSALVAVAALVWFSPFAGAADPAPAKPLVTKTFPVADLVFPIPDVGDDPGPINVKRQKAAVADGAARLMKLVTAMVRPHSWDGLGGAGKLAFFEISNALEVTNSAEVIGEVGDILEALRRLQELSVATEVRVVKAPAGLLERAGAKAVEGALTDRELKRFLDAAQENRESSVTQFPKVTTFDGQPATIRAGERRLFVTGGEVAKVKGQAVFVPKQTPVDLGDTLEVCGAASADRKFVNLKVKVARTNLVGEVELVPVTLTIKPQFADGSRGQSIPFTQYLQAPEFETQSVEKSVVVPDGGTVIIGGWNGTTPSAPVPVMSKIPYVSRLFKNGDSVKEYEVVVLATARIIISEEKSASPRR